jgi:hypothetical protein
MHEAQDVYNAKGEKNKARGVLRHGKAISENLTPLLDLIPDQYGLSVLRGGLALIFKVCKTRLDAEILRLTSEGRAKARRGSREDFSGLRRYPRHN